MQPETYFIVAPLDDHDHDGDVLNPVKVFNDTKWVKQVDNLFPGKTKLHVWVKEGNEAPKLVEDALPLSELKTMRYCGQYLPMAGVLRFCKVENCPAAMTAAEPRARVLANKSQDIQHLEFTALSSPAKKLVRALNQLKAGLDMLTTQHDVIRLNIPEGIPKAAYLLLPDDENKPIWQRVADLKLTIDLDSVDLYYFTEVEGRLVLEKLVLNYSEQFKKTRNGMPLSRPEVASQDKIYLEGSLVDACKTESSFNGFFVPTRTTLINDCSDIQAAARQTLCRFVLNRDADPNVVSMTDFITSQWPTCASELLLTWEEHKARIERERADARFAAQMQADADNDALPPEGGFGQGPQGGEDEATQLAIAAVLAEENPQPPQARENGRNPQRRVQPRPTAPVVDDMEDAETQQAMAASRLEYERAQRERHQVEHPEYYGRNQSVAMSEEDQLRIARERSLQEQHDLGGVVVDEFGEIIEPGHETDLNAKRFARFEEGAEERLDPAQASARRPDLGRFFRELGRKFRRRDDDLLMGSDIRTRCRQLADRLESLDMSGVTAGVRSRPTGFTQMIRDLRRFQRSRTEPTEAEVLAQLKSRVNSRPKMPVCGGTPHRDPDITQGFYDEIKEAENLNGIGTAIETVESKLASRGSVPKK